MNLHRQLPVTYRRAKSIGKTDSGKRRAVSRQSRLRPLRASKELEPYFRLANLKLPEADALEEPPTPRSLSDVIRTRGEEETRYDGLLAEIQSLRNSALINARRKEFARQLLVEACSEWSITLDELLARYRIRPTAGFGGDQELYDFRHYVRAVYSQIASRNTHEPDPLGSTPIISVNHAYVIDSEGKITLNLGAWEPFENLLLSVDARRMRQCDECGNFFYALREIQGTCSRKCGGVKRTAQWRDRRKARIEQTSQMLSRGYDLALIARELNVSTKQARSYVTAVKADKKGEMR
jgi:hypothetical protein